MKLSNCSVAATQRCQCWFLSAWDGKEAHRLSLTIMESECLQHCCAAIVTVCCLFCFYIFVNLQIFLIGQNCIHPGHLGCVGFEDKWIKLDFTRACLVRFLYWKYTSRGDASACCVWGLSVHFGFVALCWWGLNLHVTLTVDLSRIIPGERSPLSLPSFIFTRLFSFLFIVDVFLSLLCVCVCEHHYMFNSNTLMIQNQFISIGKI